MLKRFIAAIKKQLVVMETNLKSVVNKDWWI